MKTYEVFEGHGHSALYIDGEFIFGQDSTMGVAELLEWVDPSEDGIKLRRYDVSGPLWEEVRKNSWPGSYDDLCLLQRSK